MNRTKFSTIAHRDHTFANPLGEAKVDRVLDLMNLRPGECVADIGCGNAEMLIRLIERYAVRGMGVDPNAEMIAQARHRAHGRIPEGRLELHEGTAASFVLPVRALDAALCIGATHAYGGYMPTLAALKGMVRSGGRVLVGEGYWKREPHPDYLALLGAKLDELTDHASNVRRAEEQGLTPLYSIASDDDDWDHYEGLYNNAMERYTAEHPDDPDSEEFRAYIRRWYGAYLRWGRDTLGFGLYLFRV